MITKDDVQKALANIGEQLPEVGKSDAVEKAGARPAKGGSVPTDGDLNSSNGSADDGGSLNVEADNMNDKYGNKKGKKKKMGYEKAMHYGDDYEDHDMMKKKKKKKDMGSSYKSMPADFEAELSNEIETKVDVSNFLKSLVDHTAESHDTLRDYVVKSDLANDARYDELVDNIEGLQKSLANVGIVLKAICERFGVIENQPQTIAKSQKNEVTAGVADRPVLKSDPTVENVNQAEGQEIYKSLSGKPPQVVKLMIAEKLCDFVKAGEAKAEDVINFETYAHVSPELDGKLRKAFA